jgi:hypothetical protein
MRTFPRVFNIHYSSFPNLSKDPDLDYLSDSIPDIIISYLKPLESETVYYPFDSFEFTPSTEIVNLLSSSNSIFSNYITNVQLQTTQFRFNIFTNKSEEITNRSYITNVIDKKNKKVLTNIIIISTNMISTIEVITNETNITSTNIKRLPNDNFKSLILKEYPDLTNTISQLSIVFIKDTNNTSITNLSTNSNVVSLVNSNPSDNSTNTIKTNQTGFTPENFYCSLSGNFTSVQNSFGPNKITPKINFQIILLTNTNSYSSSLESPEDSLSDNLYDVIKPIRKLVLNRSIGDLWIISTPDTANIYLDGYYIGISPLYFPSVPIGKHVLTFLKEGYHQSDFEAQVIENKTNIIQTKINKMTTGGIITIKSEPTNATAYIDSSYIGNTPIALSNITLGVEHRLKVESYNTNLAAYYKNFTLFNTNQSYGINAVLPAIPGQTEFAKNLAWWMSYGGWGITLASVGLNIYCHYKLSYYDDLYVATLDPNYLDQAYFYNTWYNNTTLAWIVSGLGALWLTQNALHTEEIYLGLDYKPNRSIRTTINIEF